MTDKIKGQCVCGDVRFQVSGPVSNTTHCHCSMCRRVHGTAYATYCSVPAGSLEWLSGEDTLTIYESSPGFRRAFCSTCGSPAPSPGSAHEGLMFFPAGLLDEGSGAEPEAHIFVGSKAPWYELDDSLTKFDAYPPGYGTVVDRPPSPAHKPGTVGGECLCGAVAYEYDGAPGAAYFCHCQRCRRARAAAFATNMFVPAGAFRWLRGEESVVTYKLPEAQRFGQAFCGTCGSKVPRVREGAPMVAVPAGAVDGDPGARPSAHIYTGSKAAWDAITDALPQHEEGPP